MDFTPIPREVIWDVTYACPLRCLHCYSESGRRPARAVDPDSRARIADAIISMRPQGVSIAGGEPLLLRDLGSLADRIRKSGIPVSLYTSGWLAEKLAADEILQAFTSIVVSVDGATAEVHDRIRGRRGSFDRAMKALRILSRESARRRARGEEPLKFGIDCVVLRSNYRQIEQFCTLMASRYPELDSLAFGAAVPSGLASRAGVAEHELLTDDQVTRLEDPQVLARLKQLLPGSVHLYLTGNKSLQMHPDQVAQGTASCAMQIEPDGQVRAMPIYEGTVGSLLEEAPEILWRRAQERWGDPFVVAALSRVRTMQDWAVAARRIDYHFGTPEVRSRIDRRPVHHAAC
ncbi:radical SAM protein [Streptomyces sp. NPDC004787]|uniref:radical SAM protein n=1 Tax=Streptomyces sp. NPDC004787 TaxID=3154291 RepID=UPI00339F09EA